MFFLLDVCGYRFFCNIGKDFPEAVLGMSIIKLLFAGFYRGKCAQNQNFGIFIENRCKFMGVVLVVCHKPGSFLLFMIIIIMEEWVKFHRKYNYLHDFLWKSHKEML